ncbi:uncharacterized protein [Malus domestica]|uniref:uncharacterized protein n=1 Tax=Malus domestica TaxID=3750 RepID=UPI0004992FE0
MERLLAHWYAIAKHLYWGINLIEFLAEDDNGPVLSLDKVQAAPAELDDNRPQVKDPLEEINVGTADDPWPLFISALLPHAMKVELHQLLHEFKDCFAWSYHEMFIQTTRYIEWLANIVPVLKKNGALRICIDFQNLNLATPKDAYPMPISDLLIDAAANHEMLSFMDGHAGYNQIFIIEADVHKTAFRCPGALRTYEWVVMPFGLKNAGATYQHAMNTIFHDLIGTTIKVYIDDVVVIAQTNVIRYMLTRPIVKCRIRKWTLALSEFSLQYVLQKAVKGQTLVDFLAHHHSPYRFGGNDVEIGMVEAHDNYWTMYFDGSSTSTLVGVGIILQFPHQHRWFFSLKLDFDCTNNQVEYEALIIGLSMLHDLRAVRVLIFSNSELVINQLNGTFRCMSCTLAPYHMVANYLVESFDGITFKHISCGQNTVADELAQIASEAQLLRGKSGPMIPVLRQSYPALVNQQVLQRDQVIRTWVMSLPSLLEREDPVDIYAVETLPNDWRRPIMQYLNDPRGKHDQKTRVHATNYVSY